MNWKTIEKTNLSVVRNAICLARDWHCGWIKSYLLITKFFLLLGKYPIKNPRCGYRENFYPNLNT
jgi:hypothetical protein